MVMKGKAICECPNCRSIFPIDMEIDLEHVYDHIMGCDRCLEQAGDYIFTKFVGMGVPTNISGIRQALRFFDEFLIKKIDGEIDMNGETDIID